MNIITTSNEEVLDATYTAIINRGINPIVKVGTTAYLRGGEGSGLMTATHRTMFGTEDTLAAAIREAGLEVRDMGSNEWSVWVTFDLTEEWLIDNPGMIENEG